ncbi:MAG: sigma-70 family RNA polymerase sigma factor [Actinomycetota bacterium]|nr:sigma-70 family RNA polymerase sigma factor [Actinomycetota bacterium]
MTELALAARDGDEDARRDFVLATQADVWRLCRMLGDPDEVDDLTQETYLRALGALRRFRGDASARTWLLGIARRVCADGVRRRVRRRRLDQQVRETSRAVSVGDGADARALDELIAHLPADRREAFVLTQIIGLSYEEAAAVCSCPIGTIRSRVARARGALLELLAEGGDEDAATS